MKKFCAALESRLKRVSTPRPASNTVLYNATHKSKMERVGTGAYCNDCSTTLRDFQRQALQLAALYSASNTVNILVCLRCRLD